MEIINHIFALFDGNFSFLGYFVLALVAFLEATPMFGFVVPGQVVAVGSGLLARIGTVDFSDAIVALSIGAILGDTLGYYLGKKYGEDFIIKYGKYFFLQKDNFAKTKELIGEHAGKTIIIGRFNSVARAVAPFSAGSVGVPFLKFFIFNIISGISWAVVFSALGYLFGDNYRAIADYFGEFLLIGIIIGALIIYSYKKINKKRRIFHRRHLDILLINLFSLYIFSKMIENFVDQELVIQLDIWINEKISLLWNPLLNSIMIFITNVGSAWFIVPAAILMLIFFIRNKKWRYSLLLIFSLSGGKILEVFTKHVIARHRPEHGLIFIDGYSFPSGHATASIIFFAILAYYLKNHIQRKSLKISLILLCITITFLIGFSRVYLKVHWFSDIIAGFALGMFWLTLMVLFLEFITSVFKEKVKKIKEYLK